MWYAPVNNLTGKKSSKNFANRQKPGRKECFKTKRDLNKATIIARVFAVLTINLRHKCELYKVHDKYR